ncbi:DUF2848 family protein [Anaerobacillus sp. MEB173]|uniref:DUF2848 family protein n=1 Tax=Anaerobacillus sp. MEB173 TaxID=3383345 RepID=UPI003F90F97C
MTTKNISIAVNGEEKDFSVESVYCIGYSGRDTKKVKEHIDELAELGIPAPPEVPMLYPVRLSSLTNEKEIEVLGQETSGEAEIVLIFGESNEDVYVSVGSDHTDRGLETVDINKSKQICEKPMANKAWKLNDVVEYWDELKLVSKVLDGGEWKPYQEQNVSAILPLEEILTYLKNKSVQLTNAVVFAGTVPLLNGFVYGDGYKMELIDPIKNDSISSEYLVSSLVD